MTAGLNGALGGFSRKAETDGLDRELPALRGDKINRGIHFLREARFIAAGGEIVNSVGTLSTRGSSRVDTIFFILKWQSAIAECAIGSGEKLINFIFESAATEC